MFNFNHRPTQEQARSSLFDAINAGQSLLRDSSTNLTDKMFDIWFDYSRKCIQRAFGQDSYKIESNYLEINISFLRNNLSATQKLEYCIRFLLDVVGAI